MYCPDIHVRKGNFEYIVILFIYLLYNLLTVLYQSLLYSKGTQLYIYIHILFLYSFPNYGLSQDTEYSSWCCTLAPCFLSILNVIVCIYQSSTLSPSLFIPTAPWHECIVILKLKVIILSFNCFFGGGGENGLILTSWNFHVEFPLAQIHMHQNEKRLQNRE